MTTRITTICLAAALLLVQPGCGLFSGSKSVDGENPASGDQAVRLELAPTPTPRIADLPVPAGFKLDEDDSWDVVAAGGRHVAHVYRGRADRVAVRDFYEKHMASNRWEFGYYRFVSSDIFMLFQKESETCHIIISKGGWWNNAVIKVNVWTATRIKTQE